MGGYNATLEDYWNGEALIVSFINSNVDDKTSAAFKKLSSCEGGFLEIMKNADLKFFEYAYFSERSIEDEIDATTEDRACKTNTSH